MNLKPTQGLFKFDFTDHHAFLGVSVDADATGVRDRYKEVKFLKLLSFKNNRLC
jgi:hypothetical protein